MRYLRREDDLPAAILARAQVLDHDEDERQDRGEPEPEVGALLRDELAQLPAVDRQRGRSFEAGDAQRRGRGRCTDAAHGASTRRSSLATGAARAWAGSPSPLFSVSRKNRSSSVASSGVSERIATLAAPSASDRAPTSDSWAWKESPCSPRAANCMPGCSRATSSARPSSVVCSL